MTEQTLIVIHCFGLTVEGVRERKVPGRGGGKMLDSVEAAGVALTGYFPSTTRQDKNLERT